MCTLCQVCYNSPNNTGFCNEFSNGVPTATAAAVATSSSSRAAETAATGSDGFPAAAVARATVTWIWGSRRHVQSSVHWNDILLVLLFTITIL